MDPPADQFANICFGYSVERLASLRRQGLRVAHYTTAENGMNILRSRRMWLRNSAVMNDFSEVAHGRACLEHALSHTKIGSRLQDVMDGAHPGIWEAILKRLEARRVSADPHIYLTSLSEIDPEDVLGKLSMWRAYGGNTAGVALVFNTDGFQTTNDLGFYHSPVLYGDKYRFQSEFEKVVAGLEQNRGLLSWVPRPQIEEVVANALHYSILSTKHPAFEEEAEWRIIYSAGETSSTWIEVEATSIRGVPQIVCKLPIENLPGMDMPNLELDRLLHKIIIGPCLYPRQVGEAYAQVLIQQGLKNPWNYITLSQIPLRQWG